MNYNPREEPPATDADHARAALRLHGRRPATPALANDQARRARSCPHCRALVGDHCVVPSTGRALSDGAVHPARLALTTTTSSTTDPNRSQP